MDPLSPPSVLVLEFMLALCFSVCACMLSDSILVVSTPVVVWCMLQCDECEVMHECDGCDVSRYLM